MKIAWRAEEQWVWTIGWKVVDKMEAATDSGCGTARHDFTGNKQGLSLGQWHRRGQQLKTRRKLWSGGGGGLDFSRGAGPTSKGGTTRNGTSWHGGGGSGVLVHSLNPFTCNSAYFPKMVQPIWPKSDPFTYLKYDFNTPSSHFRTLGWVRHGF